MLLGQCEHTKGLITMAIANTQISACPMAHHRTTKDIEETSGHIVQTVRCRSTVPGCATGVLSCLFRQRDFSTGHQLLGQTANWQLHGAKS